MSPSNRVPGADQSFSPSWEWRWFLGTVIIVPTLLLVGVYWLHELPAGVDVRANASIVQVHLTPIPTPAPQTTDALQQAVARQSPPITDFNSNVAVRSEHAPDDFVPAPPAMPLPPSTPMRQELVTKVGGAAAVPNSVVMQFRRALLAHIERYRNEPEPTNLDRSRIVQVGFSMRRDGAVLDAWVQVSSGQRRIDREAVDIIRRSQPLPPIPTELPERLSILLPISVDP
jgi:periplasmic protein TonB